VSEVSLSETTDLLPCHEDAMMETPIDRGGSTLRHSTPVLSLASLEESPLRIQVALAWAYVSQRCLL
jgi:hypothetical protein